MKFALVSLCLQSLVTHDVNGHGFLMNPKSRNFWASTLPGGAGQWWCQGDCNNVPKAEDCYHCMNGNNGGSSMCGVKQSDSSVDYGHPKNYLGSDLGWQQPSSNPVSYSEGQVITVEAVLTTHHMGHFEVYACPDATNPTTSCFESHPLTFVSDNLYGAPKDTNYPQRAYIPPATFEYVSNNGGRYYSYQMKLPDGVSGNVLLQWRYITGNSCKHVGYDSYPFPSQWGTYASMYEFLPNCPNPLPVGSVGAPERFWNCAEVNIGGGSNPAPAPAPAPAPGPTPSPGTYCGDGNFGNGVCQDGTCCSHWGWCGTTDAHCNTTAVSCGNRKLSLRRKYMTTDNK